GVNALIWYLLFNGLADDIGRICAGGAPPWAPFSEAWISKVRPLCSWPASGARTESLLFDFWLALTQYDLPQEEFRAFRDFFLGPEFAKASGPGAVKAMSLAILMNPYFTLK